MHSETVVTCPMCGSGMHPVFRDGRVLFWGCDEYRGGAGCRGKRYPDPDNPTEPLPYVCPECHQGLCRRTGRNGRPYTACFEKDLHASRDALFFNDDGTPQEPPLRAKGTWKCPVCGEALRYIRIRNGPHAGSTAFACFASDRHEGEKPLFFEDNDGMPVLPDDMAKGEAEHA